MKQNRDLRTQIQENQNKYTVLLQKLMQFQSSSQAGTAQENTASASQMTLIKEFCNEYLADLSPQVVSVFASQLLQKQ